jgi:hypothetical protein
MGNGSGVSRGDRLLNPITRCRDQPHNCYAGTDDGRGTGQTLDTKRLTLMTGRSLTELRCMVMRSQVTRMADLNHR